mmetsp:Transcript_44459/g.71212  ORF Transcript_44459/g.71212 Transcript_44459/m.71212 type:complete len:267 (+) Transcript_44459:150-950(+)
METKPDSFIFGGRFADTEHLKRGKTDNKEETEQNHLPQIRHHVIVLCVWITAAAACCIHAVVVMIISVSVLIVILLEFVLVILLMLALHLHLFVVHHIQIPFVVLIVRVVFIVIASTAKLGRRLRARHRSGVDVEVTVIIVGVHQEREHGTDEDQQFVDSQVLSAFLSALNILVDPLQIADLQLVVHFGLNRTQRHRQDLRRRGSVTVPAVAHRGCVVVVEMSTISVVSEGVVRSADVGSSDGGDGGCSVSVRVIHIEHSSPTLSL